MDTQFYGPTSYHIWPLHSCQKLSICLLYYWKIIETIFSTLHFNNKETFRTYSFGNSDPKILIPSS